MIELLISTYSCLGCKLVKTAEFIIEKIEKVETINIETIFNTDILLYRKLIFILAKMDKKNSILILADIFDSTLNNVSLAFLIKNKIKIVPELIFLCLLRLLPRVRIRLYPK